MADVFQGLTIEFRGDTKGLTSALKQIQAESRGVAGEAREIDRALKINPTSVALATRQIQLMERQVAGVTERLRVLRQAEASMGDFVGPWSPQQQEQWTKLQAEIAIAEGRLDAYKRTLSEARVRQDALNTALGQFGQRLVDLSPRLDKVGRAMQAAGRGLTYGLTVPLAAAGAASVKAAVDIDTALTGVRKTVDGTEEQYQALKAAAVEFSLTNAVTAEQILDIQALGAQLGFAIDELQEFGEVVSGLDIATNMDADTAATEMAQFANICKMGHDEVSNYGSAIVGLGNSFATTESDISAMAMRLAAAGTQVGMSEADILGLATALSSMGMEAEAGGTALSTIMAAIDKAVATGSESLADWAAAAQMSAGQFSEAWRADPVSALAAVLSGMEGATAAGGNMSVMLDELGVTSLRQTDAMKRLAGNSEFVARAVAVANDEWEANTALSDEVANRNESLAAKFEMLRNRVTAIAYDVGGPLADALLDVLDAAEPLIESIASGARAFADMDEADQRLVLSIVALSAAVGPLLNVGGRLLTHAKDIGEACRGMAERMAASKAAAGEMSGGMDKAAKSAAGLSKMTTALYAGYLAIAYLVGQLIGHYEAYSAKVGEARDATDGMRRAVESARGEYDSSALSASAYGMSMAEVGEMAREAIKGQGSLAAALEETWAGLGRDSAVVRECAEVIEELSGKVDEAGGSSRLSASEQARLTAAVATLNETCGTTYEVLDAVTGTLDTSTDSILRNARAWEESARAQAAQEALSDIMGQRMENARAQEEVDRALAEAEESLGIAIGGVRLAIGSGYDDYRNLQGQKETLEEADRALADAEAYYQGQLAEFPSWAAPAAEAAGTLARAAAGATESAEGASAATAQLSADVAEVAEEIGKLAGESGPFAAALAESGWSAEELAQRLAAAGVEAKDLAKAVEDYAAKAGDAFGVIEQKSDISLEKMLDNLRRNGEITRNWSANIAALYDKAGSDSERAFIGHISSMGPEYAPIVQKLLDDSSGMLGTMAAEWESSTRAGREAAMTQAGLMRDGLVAECQAAGDEAPAALAAGIEAGAPAAEQAASDAADAASAEFSGLVPEAGSSGDESAASFAAGIAAGEEASRGSGSLLRGAAAAGVAGTAGDLGGEGSAASLAFGGHLADYRRQAAANAGLMADAAAGMARDVNNAGTWGAHLGQNFANGLAGATRAIRNAASAAASAIANILGHTVPKEGPLHAGGRGEALFGLHCVENYASGMRAGLPALRSAAEEAAALQARVLTSAAPKAASLRATAVRAGGERQGGVTNYYSFGDVTVDASRIDDKAPVESLVAEIERAKLMQTGRR